jgi:sensor domain CHASE-containing protein/HPt (histidine-containing phosphotransfer) domain-containing protein/PAS domain-containing protein
MTLRNKTLLLIFLFVGALAGLLYLVLNNLVLRSFERSEEAQMHKKLQGVSKVIRMLNQEVNDRFSDWSSWDDTASYLSDGNKEYFDANVTITALKDQLQIQYMAIVLDDGTIRFAVTQDKTQENIIDASTELNSLIRDSLLRGADKDAEPFSGLWSLSDGVYLFISRPVLSNEGKPTERHGRFIIGRRLDDAWLKRLETFTFLQIKAITPQTPASNEEENSAREALLGGATEIVVPSNDPMLRGYLLLQDLKQKPVLFLQVQTEHQSLAYGSALTRTMAWLIGAVGLMLMVGALLLLGYSVLTPLEKLSEGVDSLEKGQVKTLAPTTRDEFGRLMLSFNKMATTLQQREGELRRINRDLERLLDSLAQGILTFDEKGVVVGESSRRAQELFQHQTLAGQDLKTLLFAGGGLEAEALDEWISFVFSQPPEAFTSALALAPMSAILFQNSPKEIRLSLSFRPLIEDGKLQRVLLLATDITEQHMLTQEKEAQAKALDEAKQLAQSAHLYISFLQNTAERIQQIEGALSSKEKKSQELIARQIHTLKGEARLFGEPQLEEDAIRAEEALVSNRIEELQSLVPLLKKHLAEAQEEAKRSSPVGEQVFERWPARREDIVALQQETEKLPKVAAFIPMRRAVERLISQRFQDLTAPFVARVPRWAAELNKEVSLQIEGGDCLISQTLAEPLFAALTHLLRNAISHGIEAPSERGDKPKTGKLRLVATSNASSAIEITIEDDGRGIDIEALKKKALALGAAIPQEPSELVFFMGLSTSSGLMSGKGVGMSAAREELRAVRYNLSFTSTPGQGTRWSVTPLA